MIKAIDTFYNGCFFRSRLEARYAVFFDALGIEWLYENEGYDLDGIWYLPDFWLPTFDATGMFAEVKPKTFESEEIVKAYKLCLHSNKPVMLCVGKPDYKVIEYLSTEHGNELKDFKGVGLMVGLPNADQAAGENRMYAFPGYENEYGFIEYEDFALLGDTFVKAVKTAQKKRFDKGDKP